MMYLFPFEKICPHERIVLYGYGQVGRQFLRQIEQTKYCNIVAIIDHHHDVYTGGRNEVLPVEAILKLTYDKVVIAINNPNRASNAREVLTHTYSVQEERIVLGTNRQLIYEGLNISVPEQSAKTIPNSETIQAAFYLGAGLGDAIIAKVFIENFIRCIPPQCKIDIITTADGYKPVKAIFGCFSGIRDIGIRGQENTVYDYAISVAYCLTVLRFDEKHIREKNPALADMLCQLQDKINDYGLDLTNGTQYRVHFDRCRVLGYTCYTAYNYYGVCDIHDWHTEVPLLPKYEATYKSLGLRQYITINYGWGLSDSGVGHPPNKVWSIAHYNELVLLLRKRFPDYSLVQVGLSKSEKIIGIDHYVFGQELEVVKYILRDAVLHIDCEGGLVHLATQLGTKCAVLFGPTPVYYFGYKDNINIVSERCEDCYYLYDDFSVCARGMEKPECMYSIKPEMVMEKVETYLKSYVHTEWN